MSNAMLHVKANHEAEAGPGIGIIINVIFLDITYYTHNQFAACTHVYLQTIRMLVFKNTYNYNYNVTKTFTEI